MSIHSIHSIHSIRSTQHHSHHSHPQHHSHRLLHSCAIHAYGVSQIVFFWLFYFWDFMCWHMFLKAHHIVLMCYSQNLQVKVKFVKLLIVCWNVIIKFQIRWINNTGFGLWLPKFYFQLICLHAVSEFRFFHHFCYYYYKLLNRW